ncbi:hypothetical protein H257_08133, partial [Aphanomyces astaci]
IDSWLWYSKLLGDSAVVSTAKAWSASLSTTCGTFGSAARSSTRRHGCACTTAKCSPCSSTTVAPDLLPLGPPWTHPPVCRRYCGLRVHAPVLHLSVADPWPGRPISSPPRDQRFPQSRLRRALALTCLADLQVLHSTAANPTQ